MCDDADGDDGGDEGDDAGSSLGSASVGGGGGKLLGGKLDLKIDLEKLRDTLKANAATTTASADSPSSPSSKSSSKKRGAAAAAAAPSPAQTPPTPASRGGRSLKSDEASATKIQDKGGGQGLGPSLGLKMSAADMLRAQLAARSPHWGHSGQGDDGNTEQLSDRQPSEAELSTWTQTIPPDFSYGT